VQSQRLVVTPMSLESLRFDRRKGLTAGHDHRRVDQQRAAGAPPHAAMRSRQSMPTPDRTYLLTVGVCVLMMWLSTSRTAPAGGVRPPTQMA
jgi:hypothetical protein